MKTLLAALVLAVAALNFAQAQDAAPAPDKLSVQQVLDRGWAVTVTNDASIKGLLQQRAGYQAQLAQIKASQAQALANNADHSYTDSPFKTPTGSTMPSHAAYDNDAIERLGKAVAKINETVKAKHEAYNKANKASAEQFLASKADSGTVKN